MSTKASFLSLFKFATSADRALLILGSVASVLIGALQPVLFYILGKIYDNMGPKSSPQEFFDQTVFMVYLILILGTCYLFVCYFAIVAWVQVGGRQSMQYRSKSFLSLLMQDPAWFDRQNLAELPVSLNSQAVHVERATGDKIVMVIMTLTLIVTGLVIDVIVCLQLMLLSVAFLPLAGGGLILTNQGVERMARTEDTAYKTAAGICEEMLGEVKTIAALSAEKEATDRYAESLSQSYGEAIVNGGLTGAGTGLAVASFLAFAACACVVGSVLMREEQENWTRGDSVSLGSIAIVFFVSIMAFFSIGTFVPSVKSVVQGQLAAKKLLDIIESVPTIKSGSHTNEMQGNVQFKNVDFAYPSNPSKMILTSLSLSAVPREKVAIVGETGSGKSTLVSLLLRFYDVSAGELLIDGLNIKDWDLSQLRGQIGLVSQDPVLFNGSILENIRLGKAGATDLEVETVSDKVCLGAFVRTLPNQFQTEVGNKGSQLSGGEKQRVAIARAIIRRPKLMILDEATSALDNVTERSVQETLNSIMDGFTTIMIAHRISTVKNANKILVLASGRIVEEGTYDQLMERKGQFYRFAMLQHIEVTGEEHVGAAAGSMEEAKVRQVTDEEETLLPNRGKPGYMRRFMSMTQKECKWVLFGTLGSALVASTYPLSGMFLGYEIFVLGTESGDDIETDSRYYAWFYGLCAVVVLIGFLIESISFPVAAAKVTRKFRELTFEKLMFYDQSYFDLHSASSLGVKLSSDCEKINNLNGSVFAALLGLLLALICSLVISGVFCWRLMLVSLAVLPLFFFSVFASFVAQIQGLVSYGYEEATVIASDAILNYRTVKSLGLESEMHRRYMNSVHTSTLAMRRKVNRTAMLFGLGYTLYIFSTALLFWYGAKLYSDGVVNFRDMSIALFTFLSGTDMISIVGVFAPDVKQGQEAAKHMFEMLDYQPAIDVKRDGLSAPTKGFIEFRSVTFAYPNRPITVLKSVSFSVPQYGKLGIVGQTGSGKSTVLQLLLRYYDPLSGIVLIDGQDIRSYSLSALRSVIGVVSQEPVLFSGSIKYNITLGVLTPSPESVSTAVEIARAKEFIEKDEAGYERDVGIKGSRLSGGEKQRVALARALVRAPKVLLFDEATSALDSGTESALVEGLKDVMERCTCIVIAHRLKTIAHIEQILVLDHGRVVETGNCQKLMENKGFFYHLAECI